MHELTEKIDFYRSGFSNSRYYIDSIIRIWLSEKVKELLSSYNEILPESVDRILGLYPEKEEPSYCFACKKSHPVNTACVPQEEKREWCEHIVWYDSRWARLNDAYKTNKDMRYRYIERGQMFCQICGTPRPKSLSLAEKFNGLIGGFTTNWPRDWSEKLAEIAEAHFKNPEKKSS